jgi:hypothetical protein
LGLVVILLLWLLRSPWLQNKIVPIVERVLTEQLGTPVEVGSVDLALPGKAVFRDLMMRDQAGLPMFAVHELRIDLLRFPLLKLITNPGVLPPIRVNHATIVQPQVHFYRSRSDSAWNFSFLASKGDTTPSKPPKIQLDFQDVHIVGGVFSMVDSTKSDTVLAQKERLNFFNLDLRAINAKADFHLHPGMRMGGKLAYLTVIEERCRQMVQEFSSEYTIELNGSVTGGLRICSDKTRLRTGRTQLIFDGDFADERKRGEPGGIYPVFNANIHPSVFDFSTLNLFLPKPLPMRDPVYVKGYLWGNMEGIYSDSVDLGLFRHTHLRTTVAITNLQSPENLGFKFSIGKGQLSFDELQLFLHGVYLPLKGIATLRGTVQGTLKKINTRNLRVSYLADTDLLLDAEIEDFQDPKRMYMTIAFAKSYINFNELRKLLPSMKLPEALGRYGRCGVDGHFKGGISDFDVDVALVADSGVVNAQLHLMLPPKTKVIAYAGHLEVRDFSLLPLKPLIDVSIPLINFVGDIDGKGDAWGTIIAQVNGKFTNTQVGEFRFQELETKGLVIDKFKIKGIVKLTDPNGDASVTLDLDLPKFGKKFVVDGDITGFSLAHYKVFPEDSIFLTTILSIDVSGDSIENFAGKVSLFFPKLWRYNTKDTVDLKTIVLNSRLEEGFNRKISLKSSLADMRLRGSFTYANAYRLVGRLATETSLYIKNNDSLTTNYYANKVVAPENVIVNDTLVTKAELNSLLAFFKLPLYLESGTTVILGLRHQFEDEVTVQLTSDSIAYDSIAMINDSLSVTFQKQSTNNELLGIGYLHIDTLKVKEFVQFCDVILEPSAVTDELDCYLRARQPVKNNEIVLSTSTKFLSSGEISTKVSQGVSHLGAKGRYWTFSPGNSIVRRYEHPPSLGRRYPDSTIARYHVENMRLANGSQVIRLEGVVSKDTADIIKCFFDDVQIRSVMEIFSTDTSMDGRIHGTSIQAWKLLSEQPSVYVGGYVDDFHYKEIDSIGLRFIGGWPSKEGPKLAGMKAVLGHWGHDSLNVNGTYNFVDDILDFEADSSSLLIGWAQPFVEGLLSDMRGRVALDKFTVKGSIKKPLLNGSVRFTGARFKVDFLNNPLLLSDNTILFNNERVVIPTMTLSDTLGGTAKVAGSIFYNESTGPRLDLEVNEIKNLLLMDTRKANSEVFYGHLVLDGDSAKITGAITQPRIEAWVKSGNGSWLDIPLSSYTSASRLDFVKFTKGGKETSAKTEEKPAGFTLELHVQAKSNARVRLIFDEFVGDIIEARGDGNLHLSMDANGDLTMDGTYVVSQGDYHFTMENVLNKKFEVVSGGEITWNGSPYEANLKLSAVYRLNADISALVPGSPSSSRIPVEIVMNMFGNLNHPEISLSLALDKLTDQEFLGLESYFRSITSDQQELNKQVVSLLMFRRFAGSASNFQSASSSVNVTSSISELVSNQVNYWIEQAFDDPKLGVEVNTNEFQDVELALRASLFDDKVTVVRNGTILGSSGKSFSLGDISVQIKVLPKADSTTAVNPNAGQLVVEIFNREDASLSNRNNSSQGTGIFFKKDFDRLKDLARRKDHMKHEKGVEIKSQ